MKMDYPLSLEKALRLFMPKKRHPDRMRIYREYLRQSHRIIQDFFGAPLEDLNDVHLNLTLEKQKRGWFTERQTSDAKENFSKWFEFYQSEILSNRATKAAAARWEKKKKIEESLLTRKRAIKKSTKHSKKRI